MRPDNERLARFARAHLRTPAQRAIGLLDEHVRHCVRDAARDDAQRADEMVTEATRAIERLVKA